MAQESFRQWLQKASPSISGFNAMTVTELLYKFEEYIKEHAIQGEQGEQGEPAILEEVVNVTTLPPGYVASAQIIPQGNNNYKLELEIPKGEKGQQGVSYENGSLLSFEKGVNNDYRFIIAGNINNANVINFMIKLFLKPTGAETAYSNIFIGTCVRNSPYGEMFTGVLSSVPTLDIDSTSSMGLYHMKIEGSYSDNSNIFLMKIFDRYGNIVSNDNYSKPFDNRVWYA